ncbi:RNA polymerase sigma factor [Winogradskyella forsetii]|uniref:RNA polymerase sigma factor n=1 Tax=Winogradskyella forsetii TaxID=2686077 RepID=UPI0015B92E45|nr:RNA polymerase sigma factor [Winogradskyella forsetii]
MDKELRILIQKCVKQDKEGQRELYTLLSPVLYGICLKYMKSKVEADDVFQDAFIMLFQKIDQYRFEGSFEGWAKRIFVNEALEVLRKKQRRLHVAIEDFNFNTDNEDNSKRLDLVLTQEELLNHIRELPDHYRMVFNLYVFEDYSHKAIANKLNIAVGTSKSILSRAKSVLRTKINAELKKKVS